MGNRKITHTIAHALLAARAPADACWLPSTCHALKTSFRCQEEMYFHSSFTTFSFRPLSILGIFLSSQGLFSSFSSCAGRRTRSSQWCVRLHRRRARTHTPSRAFLSAERGLPGGQ